MLNTTISYIQISLLKSPLMTHFSRYSIYNSQFSKFSAPLIFNSFVSITKSLFHSALSSTLQVNRDDNQIESHILDRNFNFSSSYWHQINAPENAILEITANDNVIYKWSVNIEHCSFDHLISKYLFKVSAPKTNISSCCIHDIQGCTNLFLITHPKTIDQNEFLCSQTIIRSSIYSAKELSSNPIAYQAALFEITTLNLSSILSTYPICSFTTKDAENAKHVQKFTCCSIFNSQGPLFSFSQADSSHYTLAQVDHSNFVQVNCLEYAVQTNYQVFFFWNYFQKISFSTGYNYSTMWRENGKAKNDATTFIIFVNCAFDFEPHALHPTNQYDDCIVQKSSFQTTMIEHLNMFDCKGFTFTATEEPFHIPGFKDDEFIGAIVSFIAIVFIFLYFGYFIYSIVKKGKETNQPQKKTQNEHSENKSSTLLNQEDERTNSNLSRKYSTKRGSMKEPTKSKRGSRYESPSRKQSKHGELSSRRGSQANYQTSHHYH